MSETPSAESLAPDVADPSNPPGFVFRLAYAVYGALNADLGCLIGAIAFFLLIAGSAIFAPQLTPCTSAGGIPCTH